MGIGLAIIAHDNGRSVNPVALHKGGDTISLHLEGRHTIVTHQRVGQRHQLSGIAGVCQTLRIAHHGRVEHNLARHGFLISEALSLKCCSVLQNKCYIFHLFHLSQFYHFQKEGRNVNKTNRPYHYSTVTDFAKFLGWSTFLPLQTATW